MIPVVAPRFELDECRTQAEKELIDALHLRAEAGGWSVVPVTHPRLLSFYMDVSGDGITLRTLRVDFDGQMLLAGDDETQQMATDLDASRPGVARFIGLSPAGLGHAAADWFEREMDRPIERLEWERRTFLHRRWRMADTGEGLCWSDTQNRWRDDLGAPDRVAVVVTSRG